MTTERPGPPDEPETPASPEAPGPPGASDPGADTAPYAPPVPTASPPATPPAATPPLPPGVGWASPVVTPREIAPGLVFADTPSRFVAYVIDLILVGIVTGIIAEILGWGSRLTPSTTAPFDLSQAFVTTEYVLLSVAVGGLYFIASWSGGRRATLGQHLFKIQVGNAFDGRPLALEQAVRRWLGYGDFLNLFGFVPAAAIASSGLLLIWTIVLLITTATSPTKQGLHDRLANTAVVRPANAGTGLAMACLVIVIALLVIGLVGIVALIFLGGQVSSLMSNPGAPL